MRLQPSKLYLLGLLGSEKCSTQDFPSHIPGTSKSPLDVGVAAFLGSPKY